MIFAELKRRLHKKQQISLTYKHAMCANISHLWLFFTSQTLALYQNWVWRYLGNRASSVVLASRLKGVFQVVSLWGGGGWCWFGKEIDYFRKGIHINHFVRLWNRGTLLWWWRVWYFSTDHDYSLQIVIFNNPKSNIFQFFQNLKHPP